jgi:hypothetical protein
MLDFKRRHNETLRTEAVSTAVSCLLPDATPRLFG